MSVTVEDLLKLPSLGGAKVAAGKSGLKKVVTSISVLEYANPQMLTCSPAIFTAVRLPLRDLSTQGRMSRCSLPPYGGYMRAGKWG